MLLSSLPAAMLKTYNVYERSDRIDLMLSFDAPFDGTIEKSSGRGYTALTLKGAEYIGKERVALESDRLEGIEIFRDEGDLNILFLSEQNYPIIASKTAEGYGLRLRVKTDIKPAGTGVFNRQASNSLPARQTQPQESNTDTTEATPLGAIVRNEPIEYKTYFTVLAILAVLIMILLYIRKNIISSSKQKSWLFSQGVPKDGDIRVISQKQLDIKNKIAIIETQGRRYILAISQNSINVIDRVRERGERNGEKGEKAGFESYLDKNRELLDRYLELDYRQLDDYKEKASRQE